MDAMKILGGLLGGGGASSGLGGQLIGSLLQGAAGSGGSGGSAGGLGGMLGSALGGSGGSAGGLGGLLGSALGGSSGGRGAGLGGVLGSVAMTALAGYMSRGSSSGASPAAGMGQSAAPPPPPPASGEANQQAELLVRAMLSAAKSDGRVDANEEAKIFERLGDLDEAEKDFLRREMQAPVNAAALARDVPNGLQAEVYAISLLAIELDDQAEAQYLSELAQGLGLSADQCNDIHRQLGAPEIFQ